MGTTANPRIWVDSTVYAGAIGTTAPTDTTTALNVAFKDLGFVTEDGFTEQREQDTKDHYATGGVLIRTTRSKHKRSFKVTTLESNENAFPLINPGSTQSTTTGLTTRAIYVPEPLEKAFVLSQMDGSYKRRLHIARGEVVEVAEIKAGDEDMVMFELTINVYPSSAGLLYTEITTDPAAVVS